MTKIADYRKLSADKLREQVAEKKQQLQRLINQQAADPSDDVRAKKNLKRDIARMKTVLNEPNEGEN